MRAFLSHGFRPFFLLAPGYAALAVALWVHALAAGAGQPPVLDPVVLHGHELLYGFAAAVVAGFFLTVTPNWTEAGPLSGVPLALLVGLWVLGRVLVWMSAVLPAGLVAVVDLAFLPALVLVVARPILSKGLGRQMIFLPILGVFWLGNLLVWLDGLGAVAIDPVWSLRLGLYVLLVLITVMGGRIIPSFTSSYLKRAGSDIRVAFPAAMDKLVILATVAVLVLDLAASGTVVSGFAFLGLALLHLARMVNWRSHAAVREPILLVLHVAYFWMPAGFALTGVAVLGGPVLPSHAIHALTIGAMAGLMLAVMSRAVLGHTGRPIKAARVVVAAYLLLNGAALVRVAGPALAPALYIETVSLAGGLWVAAFALFFVSCLPIVLRPRVDGR